MTRLQKDVTAWMKLNVPTKKTKFLHSHVVEYFIGRKAVDLLLLESPWSEQSVGEEEAFKFSTREQVVEFLDTLLRYKMFHRAKKIPVTEEKEMKWARKKSNEREPSEGKDSRDEAAAPDVEEEKKKKRRIR